MYPAETGAGFVPRILNVYGCCGVRLNMASVRLGLLIVLIGSVASAQPSPSFEVETVRVALPETASAGRQGGGNVGGRCPQLMRIEQERVTFRCATLIALVGYAFRLSPERISGPDWMNHPSARFDIAAKMPAGATHTQVPELMQALLRNRFKMAVHATTATGPIYALVVAKGGLKVRVSVLGPDADSLPGAVIFSGGVSTQTVPNPDGKSATEMVTSPRMGIVSATNSAGLLRWDAPNITFEGLADMIERVAPFLTSPVLDKTGTKGRFRLTLEVRLGEPLAGQDTEDAVYHAFNDGLMRLGLRLEHRQALIGNLVVDHIEKLPTEN